MNKLRKFQLLTCFVPFLSSIIVFIITMFVLTRKKAGFFDWCIFGIIFFVSVIAVSFLKSISIIAESVFLYTIISGGLLVVANVLCVELQFKCQSANIDGINRKIHWMIFGVAIIVATIILLCMMFSSSALDVPDANGPENTKLATITLDEVLTTNNQYHSRLGSEGSSGEKTEVSGALKEFDYQICNLKSKNISGIKTLQATKTQENTVTLSVTSELHAGNMEIFIFVDNQYYAQIETNKAQTITLENISDKLVVVKIAAESADVCISVTREM